ncbi:choice-of-anchor Y domain-containing protein [Fontivita pretiosa]|uniref:choice-of-anchor Y domain-containing protein n=1 Tax=Fontivita pretiosa TaxID=2989684 RepID=UPI003D163811
MGRKLPGFKASRVIFLAATSVLAADWTLGVTLYDGAAGTSPQSQGWLSYYSLPGTGVQTVAGGKTTYDSTASASERGGFSSHTILGTLVNTAFPTLDRSVGYTVSIDLKLLSETHASNDRAGFSIIAISSDLQGIELGFWTNEIWAQSGPSFTHAEGVAANTTAANTTYDLTIQGSNYSLLANGTPILSGLLRNYSSFGLPYNLPSYLFIGDDTGSAAGAFEFSRLAVAAVPEPTTSLFVAAAVLLGVTIVRRR